MSLTATLLAASVWNRLHNDHQKASIDFIPQTDAGRRIVRVWPGLAYAAAAVWLTACLTGIADAEPLRISYFTWVGYGLLFVAQEMNCLVKEGVEAELININDPYHNLTRIRRSFARCDGVSVESVKR